MIIRLLLAAAIAAPCLGCASVTRGTTESISIASTPPGATANVSGLEAPTTCVTPCVVQAKRNADITVSISKEGYEPQVIPLTKEIPGAGAAGLAGNVLVGGLVGVGVDAMTGAAQDHKPKSRHRHVAAEPAGLGAAPGEAAETAATGKTAAAELIAGSGAAGRGLMPLRAVSGSARPVWISRPCGGAPGSRFVPVIVT